MTTQISKAIAGKTYSFHSRYIYLDRAQDIAKGLNGKKHAYVATVKVKGETFYDVRTEN